MNNSDLLHLLLGLAVLLGVARALGAVARHWGQPGVLGELTAGLLLGPTLLGLWKPQITEFLFPLQGPVASVEDGVRQVAVILFLLAAGLEVDLSTVKRRSKTVVWVSVAGMVLPFGLGYTCSQFMQGGDNTTFRLFVATAMSISALPVIARILMDVGLYHSDTGQSVMGAAMIDDLIGWNVFGIVLSRVNGTSSTSLAIGVATTVGLAALILALGSRGLDAILSRVKLQEDDTIALLLTATLLLAALTEFLGIHALFGAFLTGVAFGNTRTISKKVKTSIQTLVLSFLAPLYFGGVALKLNFVTHFDWVLTLEILVLAVVGKLLGCALACRSTGLSWRLSWAVGFGMNARGAMGMVLATLALQNHLIGDSMFVALVVMAWVTSAMSGPTMKRLVATVPNPTAMAEVS